MRRRAIQPPPEIGWDRPTVLIKDFPWAPTWRRTLTIMQCVHRMIADVRWRFLPLLVLISVTVLPALADDASTALQAPTEVVTTNPLAGNATILAKAVSVLNETLTVKAPEVSTKSINVPTKRPEGRTERSEVPSEKDEIPVTSDAETAGKQNETVEERQVADKRQDEITEKSVVTTEKKLTVEKRQATDENREETKTKRTENGGVTAKILENLEEEGALEAEKRDVTEKNVETTTEKLQEEESQTESASELALQSVQLSVVVKAPKRHGEKISSGNSTDEFEQDDDYGVFEGIENGDDDDEDMEDDEGEHGMIDYEEDEDDSKGFRDIPATAAFSTMAPSTESSSRTARSPTTESSPDDVEIIKEVLTQASSSTDPAPRRPRHSQLEDDYSNIVTTTLKPRRRRPTRYKDERRVTYRDGFYPSRESLKRRKTTKRRPVKPTTVPVPIRTTTEGYSKTFNQIQQDTTWPAPTTPQFPRRRPKRRKKKVRRQKQSKSHERQVPAETRRAIEAAAAAAAAESFGADAFPSASTTVSTERLPTTTGPRSVRQNDAAVSIQQSEVNPDGSYSFSYDVVDEGRQRRTEIGTSDQVVSGRYSFTDANGRAVERVYSAGPRGFRATGTDIARKMDLSQLGPAPIPPRDGQYSPQYDGYSDPNEDPSYEFQYKTGTASRKEIADSRGDVKGGYSFFDDDGEKHVVTYYAGAEKGFNVKSAFPDNGTPLGLFFPGRGRIPPRGRTSILQHRNGAYRFTAVGPDSRREECSDSMNYRRGSYVYLDDKGVQRTVVYEAGPNIGFRIIPNPAAIPRCPSKGSDGWQNIPVQVGVDPHYYGPRPGFGALSPTKEPWSYPDTDTDDSTYPPITRPAMPSKTSPTTPRPPNHSITSPIPSSPPTTYKPPKSTKPGPITVLPFPGIAPSKPPFSGWPHDQVPPLFGDVPPIESTDKSTGNFSSGNGVREGQLPNPAFDKTFTPSIIGGYYPSPRPIPLPPRDDRPSDGHRPLPSPYPPYDHFSCCRDRLFVDSTLDDHVGRPRPIRTYVQSIDLPEDDKNGPGRAENPSVALERHVREHELKASRRQRRRRRRRRRNAP